MKIAKGCVVDLDYSLHLGDGELVDRSEPGEPLSYLHGEGQIVPGLESALEGLGVGDQRRVVVDPAAGYGEHDPRGVQKVPKEAFPPGFDPEARDGADGRRAPAATRSPSSSRRSSPTTSSSTSTTRSPARPSTST